MAAPLLCLVWWEPEGKGASHLSLDLPSAQLRCPLEESQLVWLASIPRGVYVPAVIGSGEDAKGLDGSLTAHSYHESGWFLCRVDNGWIKVYSN